MSNDKFLTHIYVNQLSRHISVSICKQLYLSELIGSSAWHFDLSLGLLAFGDIHHWQVQVLGTESAVTQTWLWSWANTASSIPSSLLGSAITMQLHGESQGIPELTEPELSLDRIDGHTIAMIASGICRANAYYRSPYDGGALYDLIMDESFPKDPTPPLARLATVFVTVRPTTPAAQSLQARIRFSSTC